MRQLLRIPREAATALGHEAVAAIRSGTYVAGSGRTVDWAELVADALAAKVSIPPDAPLPEASPARHATTRVQVVNDTTFAAAQALIDAGQRPLALNFANGEMPGGGFLVGARAQEEALCRSSALYATLEGDPMYAYHRPRPLPDSTDWAILSPRVPVFRGDDGVALEAPWLLDFLTCAAPYAPRVGLVASGDLLQVRIHRVLAIASAYGYDALVLGAWGCGAFENDPVRTAEDFHDALTGPFAGHFGEVVFAIADYGEERRILRPFAAAFAGGEGAG
jgi:uncharacterized protein (TIGR02452 family)